MNFFEFIERKNATLQNYTVIISFASSNIAASGKQNMLKKKQKKTTTTKNP